MHFLTKGAANCPGSYLSQRARGGVSVVVSTPRTLWIANRLCNSKVMRRATLPPVIFLHLGARGAPLSRRCGYCFCLGCDSSLLWGRRRPAPSPSAPLSCLKAPLAAILPHLQALQLHGQKGKRDRRRSELIHMVPNGKMHLFGICGRGTTSKPSVCDTKMP